MANQPKILAFSGSARADSYNKRLVRIAAAGAKRAGAEVTIIDLRDYPMPVFDEDTEAQSGLPASVKSLKALFLAHDGLLIASPEYNSSVTALLKNTIDWVSRSENDAEKPLACFAGKVAAILSASPGGLGGIRGLVHLRAILGNIQVLVLPDQIAVAQAYAAFNEDGTLKDAKRQAGVENIGATLARTIAKLKA